MIEVKRGDRVVVKGYEGVMKSSGAGRRVIVGRAGGNDSYIDRDLIERVLPAPLKVGDEVRVLQLADAKDGTVLRGTYDRRFYLKEMKGWVSRNGQTSLHGLFEVIYLPADEVTDFDF